MSDVPFDPAKIERPDRSLLWYYVIVAALTGPAFPITFLPLLFKYETLKYRFDEHGVAMSWGILFRKEVYLTYRRVQDIHLTRNLLQRWMGLATVAVQTASGSATPEMSIEGILQVDELRDYLYREMRGAKGDLPASDANAGEGAPPAEEALILLREIRDALHSAAANRADGAGSPDPAPHTTEGLRSDGEDLRSAGAAWPGDHAAAASPDGEATS